MNRLILLALIGCFPLVLIAQLFPSESLLYEKMSEHLAASEAWDIHPINDPNLISARQGNIFLKYHFEKNMLYLIEYTYVESSYKKAKSEYESILKAIAVGDFRPVTFIKEEGKQGLVAVDKGRVFRLSLSKESNGENIVLITIKYVNYAPITALEQFDTLQLDEKQ